MLITIFLSSNTHSSMHAHRVDLFLISLPGVYPKRVLQKLLKWLAEKKPYSSIICFSGLFPDLISLNKSLAFCSFIQWEAATPKTRLNRFSKPDTL